MAIGQMYNTIYLYQYFNHKPIIPHNNKTIVEPIKELIVILYTKPLNLSRSLNPMNNPTIAPDINSRATVNVILSKIIPLLSFTLYKV